MKHEGEFNKLEERLFGNKDPKKRANNIHFSWGPEAHTKSKDELAAMINRSLDEVLSGRAEIIELD